MGVFDVHDFVTNIIGRLYKINQGVTGVALFAVYFFKHGYSQLLSNSFVGLHLGIEETKLRLLHAQLRGMRIFHYAGKRGVSHHKTALTSAPKLVSQQAQGVSVAVKMDKV